MTTPSYQRFLAELKRRRVFRVMAVYGVVGFVVLQVVDLAVPALLLPEWTYRLVALLLLIGFPIAVILAWAFDRTPDGVQRTQPASAEEIEREVGAPAAQRWPIGIAALVGAGLVGLGAWWVLGGPDAAEARSYDSIAVLPFVDMTGDKEAEYLGDGLAEELLNALAGIQGLKVASRTSAFAFKGSPADARTIGDSLGVGLVLEGSVRGSRDQLRVTAQLIDSEDGFHLWSATYDRSLTNLLELQDDLTTRIVEALSEELDPGASADLLSPGTQDDLAYDYFLQGRHFWNKRTFEDIQVAIGLFQKAIAVDSSYAPAYAAIADAYGVPAGWGDDRENALDQAEQFARRALKLDPTLAQAHTSLAAGMELRHFNVQAAEEGYLRAIELDPNYATAHQWYGELLAATGRRDEAVEEARKAESIDPTMIISWNVARLLRYAGHYQEAIDQARTVAERGGAYVWEADLIRWLSYAALDDYEAMLQMDIELPILEWRDSLSVADLTDKESVRLLLARVVDRNVDSVDPRPTLLAHAALFWVRVDADTALDRLERLTSDPADADVRWEWYQILQDSAFDILRDHPRYIEMNARFGL